MYVWYVVLALMIFFMAKGARAQGEVNKGPLQPYVRTMQWPAFEGAQTTPIVITKSTSQVLRFDRAITRTAISNPAVCDITPIGGQDVLLNSKDAGTANLIVWDNANNIASYSLDSTPNLDKLNSLFLNVDPDAALKVVPFNGTVAVYGTVETSLKLKQIEQAAKAFDKDAISFARLRESKEILLEVRFAEVSRKNNKDFKFDYEALGQKYHILGFNGQTGIQQQTALPAGATTAYTPKGAATVFPILQTPVGSVANLYGSYADGSFLLQNYLKFLEQENILKIIARPNLVAKDGEEAQFLVGGEFPVPIVTNNNINIDYKQFGTKLKFTPDVLDNQVIRLKVETEVSELDFSNTVVLSGITIPSIIKRNHQTIAELQDNQTFVIGGLITQKINRVHNKVPLLGDIPLIGLAFNGDSYTRTDVELIVVITPHIVKPLNLNETKAFYDPKSVTSAVGAYSAPYADSQGDTIKQMITQDEVLKDINGKPVPTAVKPSKK